jgi:hypothetical protein
VVPIQGDNRQSGLNMKFIKMAHKLLHNLPYLFSKTRKIAMFHTGRCGSTVLANLISQNPMIFWDGEVYEKACRSRILKWHQTADIIQWANLRSYFAGRFYGFEIKLNTDGHGNYRQIKSDLSQFIKQLLDADFKNFIVLSRRNYLRQIVSGAVGYQTQKWQQPSHEKPLLTKLELDIDNVPYGYDKKPLLSRFAEFDTTYRLLDDVLGHQKVLRLYYEADILSDPVKGYHHVCDYLNLDRHDVTVKLGRMNPYRLSEIIANLSEIEKKISGTEYEWMLVDPSYD